MLCSLAVWQVAPVVQCIGFAAHLHTQGAGHKLITIKPAAAARPFKEPTTRLAATGQHTHTQVTDGRGRTQDVLLCEPCGQVNRTWAKPPSQLLHLRRAARHG